MPGVPSIYQLATNCAKRDINSKDFSNLYNEFYNKNLSSILDNDTESNTTSTNNNNEVSKNLKRVLIDDFLKLLDDNSNQLILSDYLVEILFFNNNYNSSIVKLFLRDLPLAKNYIMLNHFIIKLSKFVINLNDKLILSQFLADIPTIFLPNFLVLDFMNLPNDLILTITKFIQIMINKFVTSNFLNSNPSNLQQHQHQDNLLLLTQTYNGKNLKECLINLTKRQSQISKLMYRKFNKLFESNALFVKSDILSSKSPQLTNNNTLTSPQQFNKTPNSANAININTHPSIGSTASNSSNTNIILRQDLKVLRYYKNLWLNNKLINWETVNDLQVFLENYCSIFNIISKKNDQLSLDHILIDLIETSFICFAQFVSNKQYHQTHSYFNLLERKWLIFITKHLPLLILKNQKNINSSQSIIKIALSKLDDKIVKAIKSYYSEKDDYKKNTEDLFDDYSSNSLDLRHEFIKNLVMLKIESPDLINEFIIEDSMIDTYTLITTDDIVIQNAQGIDEIIYDIKKFILNSITSLESDFLNFNEGTNNSDSNLNLNMSMTTNIGIKNPLQQVLNNFENISPTKQREFSNILFSILLESIENFDCHKFSKICSLLSFNFQHCLTTILTYITPFKFTEALLNFIDNKWESTTFDEKRKSLNDSEQESMYLFTSYTWALLLLIDMEQTYEVSLRKVALSSSTLKTKDSFAINFIAKLREIPDKLSFKINELIDEEENLYPLVQNWISDLFINGSLSDPLIQNISAKQLSLLLPHIFKQVILSMEITNTDNISTIVGGLEYILQPFMLIGLIKIMFWLGQYLMNLKTDKLSDIITPKIAQILNCIISPTELNEDSKSLHCAILRLHATHLIKVLRRFSPASQSNYNVYSSDSQNVQNLDSVIYSLVNALNISPVYNIDPRITNTDNSYSQKKLGYERFLILNENPINKILSNQMNLFWNMHSSTYYNLDYLYEVINLITPRKFLVDILQTLEYKMKSYSPHHHVTGRKNSLSVDFESIEDHLFYFLILHDVANKEEANDLYLLMTTDEEKGESDNSNKDSKNTLNESNNINNNHNDSDKDMIPKQEETTIKVEENEIKPESQPNDSILDDDFDMLFGENDASMQGPDEDIDMHYNTDNQKEDAVNDNDSNNVAGTERDITMLKHNCFGWILHDMKKAEDATTNSEEIDILQKERINKYYNKYISLLQSCVF